MILRALTDTDRLQAERLWINIFGDSESFSSYYIANRFRPKHSFGAFDGARLIAMALGRPTEIRTAQKNLPALLVAGVSTLPEYRGQGLMHRLMTLLIEHAKNSGFACCYLHPVKESLYASLGFRNGTDALLIRSDMFRAHQPIAISDTIDIDSMLSVYNTVLETHDGMQIRTFEEVELLLRDYASDGFFSLIAYDAQNRPVGYLCCLNDHTVAELLAFSAPIYEALLDAAARRLQADLTALVPPDCGVPGEHVYRMQYLIFDDAFQLPLQNGFCCLSY